MAYAGEIADIHSNGFWRGYCAMINKELKEELNQIIKEEYGLELKPNELDEFSKVIEFFKLLSKSGLEVNT